MSSYKIALLPGDGIGPEVVREAVKVLQATAGQAVDSAAATEQASASVMQIERAIGEVSASIEKVAREIARFSV